MVRSAARKLLGRIIGRTRRYHVFTATADGPAGTVDPSVRMYDAERPPDRAVLAAYRACAGLLGERIMVGRLRRGDAVLLARFEGDRIIAYGWLQRWRPLRREFWWLAGDVICLGPFWTHPDYRGRGIYGRLLGHSLAECGRRGWKDVYIWADVGNEPSIRGIEKAGFRSVGTHEVSVYLFGAVRRHRALAQEP